MNTWLLKLPTCHNWNFSNTQLDGQLEFKFESPFYEELFLVVIDFFFFLMYMKGWNIDQQFLNIQLCHFNAQVGAWAAVFLLGCISLESSIQKPGVLHLYKLTNYRITIHFASRTDIVLIIFYLRLYKKMSASTVFPFHIMLLEMCESWSLE